MMMNSTGQSPVLSVSDFVAVFNQTLDFAYPDVSIVGELSNYRVSKNRWVYFDLKDEFSSLKFFGTVYQLPGPLEEGMILEVSGQPRLSPKYGFSINIRSIQPVGEGSIKRSAVLLEAKLRAEGLFDEDRKRPIDYPPKNIGLITSAESAAYKDFIKVINSRWSGLNIELLDVQVQGEAAKDQIISAIGYFNSQEQKKDALIMTRGGGSPDDLATFSNEHVTRAVAASKIPTLVAVGHEIDVSLAELAADQRASTPSNAAELLVPDKKAEFERLKQHRKLLLEKINQNHIQKVESLKIARESLGELIKHILNDNKLSLNNKKKILRALSPDSVLNRGYALVRTTNGQPIKKMAKLKLNTEVLIDFSDGRAGASITSINHER